MKKSIIIALSVLLLVNNVNVMGCWTKKLYDCGIIVPSAGPSILPDLHIMPRHHIMNKDYVGKETNPALHQFQYTNHDNAEANIALFLNTARFAAKNCLRSLALIYVAGSSYSQVGWKKLAGLTTVNTASQIRLESIFGRNKPNNKSNLIKNALISSTSFLTTSYALGNPLRSAATAKMIRAIMATSLI